METKNLLEFLNKAKSLYALEYSLSDKRLVNILDFDYDEQFTQKIDFGIFYIDFKTLDQLVVVDGINRLLSLSLLLHAICECYKKTSLKNDNAIKTIREKYLLDKNNKTKLKLPEEYQNVYQKILFGEKLSGKEKNTEMFKLLHNYWSQIKNEGLQASKIFTMLEKLFILIVETDKVSQRDLYNILNKYNREINQLLLIDDYLEDIGVKQDWDSLKNLYKENNIDIKMFFRDYFITKFNFKKYQADRLYDNFVNYFETMLKYISKEVLIQKIIRVAKLYLDVINVNLPTKAIKKAFINIKMHNGEDTYAYILNIYEDYSDGNLSESTFLEILNTIDEYLQKREKTPNNVTFNELISYLNAFITCK